MPRVRVRYSATADGQRGNFKAEFDNQMSPEGHPQELLVALAQEKIAPAIEKHYRVQDVEILAVELAPQAGDTQEIPAVVP